MSTMEPEVMEDGRRMDGNSIYFASQLDSLCKPRCTSNCRVGMRQSEGAYQAFVFREKDGNTSINFAHSQLNEHYGS